MKIALLNDQLNAGGAERVIVNTANLLHHNGHQVKVVLFLGRAALDALLHPAISVIYLHRRGRFDIRAMKVLKQALKDVEMVHVHSRYNLRYLLVCKLLAGIGPGKIVFHEHIPILKLDLFTAWCLKRVDAYIAVLQSMCTWMQGKKLVKEGRIFYLPNIVKRPQTEIEPACFVPEAIVMVGNFMKLKNQQFAIDLLQQLPEAYTLDIYGMVHHHDYYIELQQYIKQCGLGGRVQLIQGVTNVYPILGKYELALHTSTHETGPLVLLEYMFAGLPFLTYATGDVAANLENEIPEVVINTFDMDEWLQRLQQVTNPSARAPLQQRMRRFVEERYTEEKYYGSLQAIYSSVLT